MLLQQPQPCSAETHPPPCDHRHHIRALLILYCCALVLFAFTKIIALKVPAFSPAVPFELCRVINQTWSLLQHRQGLTLQRQIPELCVISVSCPNAKPLFKRCEIWICFDEDKVFALQCRKYKLLASVNLFVCMVLSVAHTQGCFYRNLHFRKFRDNTEISWYLEG